MSRQTVINWRDRHHVRGIDGVYDETRSGQPRTVDGDRLIAASLIPPPPEYGVTHWSSRLLGAAT
ncbi:hypothetical protein ACWF82_00290 [Nocardia sp. NPDC055053]